MTLSRSNPRAKPRWFALLALVAITTAILATSVMAAPTFTFVPDDQGANDEPGQKDLTAQAAAFDGPTFYTAWKWDDTSWSGKNTGDACSLFDTDANGLVDYAVCVTVATSAAAEKSTRVYSCGDTRDDRCTNSVLVGTEDGTPDYCSVASATGQFGGTDTQSTCNISAIATDLSLSGLNNATLLNSCSYPSEQPNSDPSDCVITVANQDVTVSTQSGGTIAWTATLTDSATLAPASATGSVVFQLFSDATCTAANLVFTSAADTTAPYEASTTITNLTADAGSDGKFYWIATYTPTGAFNGDASACGEETTVIASVTGSSGN